MSLTTVAVLFARADSIYKTIPGCDVFDIERDARTWDGVAPVVAHPPCRAWGQLRAFAKPREGEKELAILSVNLIRQHGGVLEHPRNSTIWKVPGMPERGRFDAQGGYLLDLDQWWFGHRARKKTTLYIVGCSKDRLPPMPEELPGTPAYVIQTRLRKGQPGWR